MSERDAARIELQGRLDTVEGRLEALRREVADVRALAATLSSSSAAQEPRAVAPHVDRLVERHAAAPRRAAASSGTTVAPVPAPSAWSPRELLERWELMGPRGFAIVGGAVTALGIGLLFVLAANRGWIGPAERVLIGAVASALVFASGVAVRARFGHLYAALAAVGAGAAGGYATLAAATARYDLVPDPVALPLAAAIAALTTAVSLAWGSQILAGIGLLGSALAPALQSVDTGMTPGSAAFAVIVLGATAVVAAQRRWEPLLASVAGIVVAQVVVLVTDRDWAGDRATVAVGLALAAVLLGSGILLRHRRGAEHLGSLAATLPLIGTGVALLTAARLLESGTDRGIVLFAVAGVWAGAWIALQARDRALAFVVGVSALALTGVATLELLSDDALTLAWASQAILLSAVALRLRDARVRICAFAYLGLAVAHVLAVDAPPPCSSTRPASTPARPSRSPRPRSQRSPGGSQARGLSTCDGNGRPVVPGRSPTVPRAPARGAAGDRPVRGGHPRCPRGRRTPHRNLVRGGSRRVVGSRRGGRRRGSGDGCAQAVGGLDRRLTRCTRHRGRRVGLRRGRVPPRQRHVARGWSMLEAAAGLLIGGCALRVLHPTPRRLGIVSGVAASIALGWSVLGLTLVVPRVEGYDFYDYDPDQTWLGLGLGVVALVFAVLSGSVFGPRRLRDLSTTLWAHGVVAALAAEALLLQDGRSFAAAAAVSGGLLALAALPLRERRLAVAGAIVTGLATLGTLGLVTTPDHFLEANAAPADGLWVLAVCIVSAIAVAIALAPAGREPRRRSASTVGALALYAVSLAVLDLVIRISAASVELDFERGHTVVSALWALIGLAGLVAGLVRGSGTVRLAGLGLFGVSLAKIFLYDLAELSSVARAASFIAVGAAILAGGVVLQKLSARIDARGELAGPAH